MDTILVVEDDANTNEAVCEYLKDAGYQVLSAYDGEEALSIFNREHINLIILDIMLPKVSGIAVLAKIKAMKDIPVIMLTAISDEHTQIASFDNLCDDYIIKPFSVVLLGKRVCSLLRRRERQKQTGIWTNGCITINFQGYTALGPDGNIQITPKEIDMIKYFILNEGVVLTRNQILDSVWGRDAFVEERIIDSYIKNIRKKLNLKNIVTVKGIGYKFEADYE